MDEPKGHEITAITCRKCGHRVDRINIGNELVGMQDRLKCTRCGHRGADLLRVWAQGPPRRQS